MQKIVVMDFGSQYCHLIARRIKDLGVYSEIVPANSRLEDLLRDDKESVKGIILSGGSKSVYKPNSPDLHCSIWRSNIPLLGICYGHQLIAKYEGGKIEKGELGEYGLAELIKVKNNSKLFQGLSDNHVWMNHGDTVKTIPDSFEITASTNKIKIAAFENTRSSLYGVQFHPEVSHSKDGDLILQNFIFNICNAKKNWSSKNFISQINGEIKETIGNKRAILGLSGGLDSSVAALLVNKAIGKNLRVVYVDTGLMRQGETNYMYELLKNSDFDFKIYYSGYSFFKALKGVTNPEEKRKIIGKQFIEIFETEAKECGAEFLIQGTIYSDRIESGATNHSSIIKSHHNVGGLPKDLNLIIYEPLRDLYKDEVREIAKDIDLDDKIINRYVFPGPGMGIRILGEVTREKAEIVSRATHIIEDEIEKSGWKTRTWMAFAVLPDIKNVGIQGDGRTYKYPIIIRSVESEDAMTANYSKLPYPILDRISSRITSEIKEVNRVCYDITNKPPGTMEWE